MRGCITVVCALLYGVLQAFGKEELPKDKKENSSTSPYNEEWQRVLKRFLPDNATFDDQGYPAQKVKQNATVKSLKLTNDSSEHLAVSIVNNSGTTTSQEGLKKDTVVQNLNAGHKQNKNQRQYIDTPDLNVISKVGKAYGDSDFFQPIGDGVYLMKTPSESRDNTLMKTPSRSRHNANNVVTTHHQKQKTYSNSKYTGTITGSRKKHAKHAFDSIKRRHESSKQRTELENLALLNSYHGSAENIEGIEPQELNIVRDLQKDLNYEDKNAGRIIDNEAETLNPGTTLDVENSPKGIMKIAKAVQDSDKDFIKHNPLAIDPEKSRKKISKEFLKDTAIDNLSKMDSEEQTGPVYKKDYLTSKPVVKTESLSGTSTFLDSVNKAENEITKFARAQNTVDFDNDKSLDEGAKDIINFAAAQDAKIMVGGSRIHKHKHKQNKQKHGQKFRNFSPNLPAHLNADKLNGAELRRIIGTSALSEPSNTTQKDTELPKPTQFKPKDVAGVSDTRFFMADGNDIATLNKKDEDIPDNIVNESVIDIIEPSKKENFSTSDSESDGRTHSSKLKQETTVSKNNLISDAKSTVTNSSESSNRTKVKSDIKGFRNNISDNQDFQLYHTLNQTRLSKKNSHHSGSVWKVAKKQPFSKLDKPFQIDLYLTGKKGETLDENKNVRKQVTPNAISEMLENKDLGIDTDETSDSSTDVEDVSLNEALNNQAKEMLSFNPSEFGSDKIGLDRIVRKHMEGSDGKQRSDVNFQDGISSDELNNVMSESDLNGLKDIKKELDMQDSKNSVDFYNQPSTAVSLAHKESANLEELSQDVKEAEAEAAAGVKSNEDGDPQKVKILLHIPDALSKLKEKETQAVLNAIVEKAKALLTSEKTAPSKKERTKKKQKSRVDEATLAAAKKIEEFIKNQASNEDEDDENGSRGVDSFTKKDQKESSLSGNKNDDLTESIIKAIMKSANGGKLAKDVETAATNAEGLPELKDFSESNTELKELGTADDVMKNLQTLEQKETANILEKVNGLNENGKGESMLSFHSSKIAEPIVGALKNLIKSTQEYEPSEHTVNPVTAPLTQPSSVDITSPLRINGGKVIGGNVRGGNILGGVVSGGVVTGGEIRGGKIEGGTFKNGLLINGTIENGIVEGGQIKGGKILGGDIKSGLIDGGEMKGGIIEGGHLINGSVEGGDFKGGEILGGHLISGEMDGGILKGGTINGGTLKGGVIESGKLEGGVMLSGTLRGGVIKSGVIKGGIIDKGVVVQDAEIGPGVEIHDGMVKGGKITVNSLPQNALFTSPVSEPFHTDENRSNVMYTIKVLPKPAETFKASIVNTTDKVDVPVSTSTSSTSEIGNRMSSKKAEHDDFAKSAKVLDSENEFVPSEIQNKDTADMTEQKTEIKLLKDTNLGSGKRRWPSARVGSITNRVDNDNSNVQKVLSQLDPSSENNIDQVQQQEKTTELQMKAHQATDEQGRRKQNTQQQTNAQIVPLNYYANEQSLAIERAHPAAHWELSEKTDNFIKGSPGARLLLSKEGVAVRNGHTILDGVHGYLDAGDYQGQCFSDPEACPDGFSIQMALKIYRDSVFNTRKAFIVDSGAWSPDSRGLSVYVHDGRIEGTVVTRDQTWCIHKILEPYIEKWMSLTLTWRPDKGLHLYINCDEFDHSLPHLPEECEQCTRSEGCHKTDVATRLMFGRPNKGPHFKVTHMAVGEITLYENFFDKDEVKKICGSKDEPVAAVSPSIQTPPAVQYIAPTVLSRQRVGDGDRYLRPTPASKFRKKEDIKSHQIIDNHLWPTPALHFQFHKVTPKKHVLSLVDASTDRRSSLHSEFNLEPRASSPFSLSKRRRSPGFEVAVNFTRLNLEPKNQMYQTNVSR